MGGSRPGIILIFIGAANEGSLNSELEQILPKLLLMMSMMILNSILIQFVRRTGVRTDGPLGSEGGSPCFQRLSLGWCTSNGDRNLPDRKTPILIAFQWYAEMPLLWMEELLA